MGGIRPHRGSTIRGARFDPAAGDEFEERRVRRRTYVSRESRVVGANNAWRIFRSLDSYRPSFLTHDLVAGLTLAAIAIPEQMATARLGGFPPEIGFFAFLAGSLGFAMLGANRFLSCGADSTITPIFAG